jgi:quercetin dioxygenase-like cupin family protein
MTTLNIKAYVTLIGIIIIAGCNTKTGNNMSTTEIFPKGQPLPKEWFVGNAFLTPLITKDKNNDFSTGSVTFEPNARTNWHTHPRGQVLLVIEGSGYYQEKGKAAQVIKKGDVVNIPENTEHWHGASASSKMVHIAITNYKDDVQVTWLQPVTDEEYAEVNKK